MDLEKIMKIQQEFDNQHAWNNSSDFPEIINAINKDIIGLIGEIGEFSNIIKKINLDLDSGKMDSAHKKFHKMNPNLDEELVDSFIYLIRIANHLNINLSQAYLNKKDKNAIKFNEYEI